jgi:hypothetical protein
VCVYIYIFFFLILLRVVSSLGGTLTIFYNLGGYCQFDSSLRRVCGPSPFCYLFSFVKDLFGLRLKGIKVLYITQTPNNNKLISAF